MSAKKKSKKIDEAASPIKVDSIRLVRSHFLINDKFNQEAAGEVKLKFNFQIKRPPKVGNTSKLRFAVELFEGMEVPPFYCVVEFEGQFSAEKGQEEGLETFMKYGAVNILIPFMRQNLANMIQQTGFPPVILPLIDVMKLVDGMQPLPGGKTKD